MNQLNPDEGPRSTTSRKTGRCWIRPQLHPGGVPATDRAQTGESLDLLFGLPSAKSLSATDWANAPSGTNNPATVPATLPERFYRLSKP